MRRNDVDASPGAPVGIDQVSIFKRTALVGQRRSHCERANGAAQGRRQASDDALKTPDAKLGVHPDKIMAGTPK